MKQTYDPTEFYRAHLARDPRFDGQFFVAVKTTKIYCRPTCPARKAKLQNLTFFLHAIEAEKAGYRPCLRCRPETAPGSAAWIGSPLVVQRALRLMDATALEDLSIQNLADQLGVGERWLRQLFQQELGASPQKILLSKKLDLARSLLDSSALSITDIAFSSGFQSLRRFNEAFKARFHKTPSDFRKTPHLEAHPRIHLSYRPPYAWPTMLRYFEARTLLGMEKVEGETYQRLFAHGPIRGWFKVSLGPKHTLQIEFKLNQNWNLLEFTARLKNMFDLNADPMRIDEALQEDPQLRPHLNQHPGLRIPGCWEGFELAVRAIVGQQISVKAAHTILTRLIERCGEKQSLDSALPLTHFFPTPEAILAADLSKIGLAYTRVESLKALAQVVADHSLILDGTADERETRKKLLAIKGIGPWTMEYIAMRALRNPDGFPESDLELQKKIKRLQLDPKKWAPWRAYAAVLLFTIQFEDKP